MQAASTIGGKKVNKVVLAYSGGLDTSVILKWLQDTYDCEVVTFTADLGQVSLGRQPIEVLSKLIVDEACGRGGGLHRQSGGRPAWQVTMICCGMHFQWNISRPRRGQFVAGELSVCQAAGQD